MKKRKLIRNLLLLALIIIIAGAVYAYKEYNRKSKSLHDTEVVYVTQSDSLLSQFSNNEKKSNIVFNGKAISVSGPVKSIVTDDKGFYTVVLGKESSMSSVRCSIDSAESGKAAALQLNSVVTIKGICTGYNADDMGLGADVILNRCVIDGK